MKKIRHPDIVGQRGINLIERIVLEMGFLWHPTNLDAGIDGYVEIRDPVTEEVTNAVLQVQSKATERSFQAESSHGFEFLCSQKDLDYWLGGNAPVILVVSRPPKNEAYWVLVQQYFQDPVVRKTRKVRFDKSAHRFDTSVAKALAEIAVPRSAGLFLGSQPRDEIIHSDLLPLTIVPDTYYIATTDHRRRITVFERLKEETQTPSGEWILRSKTLRSFHDLSEQPWDAVCDRGTVEGHDTPQWANTCDRHEQRSFVELLNRTLRESLYRRFVRFDPNLDIYYFSPTPDLSPRTFRYRSREHWTTRTVFKGYPSSRNPEQMKYYRHSAFDGQFVRFDGKWFLRIWPTYHFTRDGRYRSWYASENLAGIKRLENNQAVHGQVVMWAEFLREERSLFDQDARSFLRFGPLPRFGIGVGIDDTAWIKKESTEGKARFEDVDMDQLPLL